jgi:hypothetical protein
MNERGLVVLASAVLIIVGFIGIATESNEQVIQSVPSESSGGSLRVEEATQKPQSTIDQIQGSGGIQNSGGNVQTGNAGSSLQPNAGSSLPAGY